MIHEKPLLKLEHVYISVPSRDRNKRLRDIFTSNKDQLIPILHDINFEAVEGDTIGIMGLNGSGKTTLAKVLSGIYPPIKGKAIIQGYIFPILAMGTPFNNKLTGRQNVELFRLYANIDGENRTPIEQIEQVKEFSELGDYFEQPVEIYSSGMNQRLGFACSIFSHSDILIMDEGLSGGDMTFRDKAGKAIKAKLDAAKIKVIVTHDFATVYKLCTKAGLMHHGRLTMYGSSMQEKIRCFKDYFAIAGREFDEKKQITRMELSETTF